MKATYGSEVLALIEGKGLTLGDVGKALKMSKSTVWKVTNNRRVRWETVSVILTKGLGLKPASDVYKAIYALWTEDKVKKANALPDDYARVKAPTHELTAMATFRKIIRERNPIEVDFIVKAAKRAADKL